MTMSPSAGSTFSTRSVPDAVAASPTGKMVYVVNDATSTVTPITVANRGEKTTITVGTSPTAIAITPNGTTAYVANSGSHSVTPITVAHNTAGTAISVGTDPIAIAITPNGTTAYVVNNGSHSVTPITVAHNTAGTAINVGTSPFDMAITPNGATAYVVNTGSQLGHADHHGHQHCRARPSRSARVRSIIAITPNGATAYVVNSALDSVTPITTSTDTAGTAISVGTRPTPSPSVPTGRRPTWPTKDRARSRRSPWPPTRPGRPSRSGQHRRSWRSARAVGRPTSSTKPRTRSRPSQWPTAPPAAPSPLVALPSAIALNPNGTTAYVANNGSDTVTPITIGAPTYLQKTATVLPDGGTTTDAYYSGTAGPLAAVCSSQLDRPPGWATKAADRPDTGHIREGAGPAVRLHRGGQQAGVRVGDVTDIGTQGWQCTHYDSQGRMTSQSWPAVGSAAARTVTYTYGVSGNPLVNSVTTSTRTITSTVDLEGRMISYTDGWGKTTLSPTTRPGRSRHRQESAATSSTTTTRWASSPASR